MSNTFNNELKQYDFNTLKLNRSYFEESLSKNKIDFNSFNNVLSKKPLFNTFVQNYFYNFELKKELHFNFVRNVLNTFYNKSTSFINISYYFNSMSKVDYCSFKMFFLKNRLNSFISKLSNIKKSSRMNKLSLKHSVQQKKKFYNYDYDSIDSSLSLYEGSSMNIFYSQLFSMVNYFFLFIKQCCFVHFLGDSFSEYKSMIIIFNLTSPLFIIYNNLYNFSFMEWFFNLNLNDYF